MKVLLEECIPRKLKYSLPDHDCQTVPEAGFTGEKNGVLPDLAEGAGFDALVTMDKGVEYEQNLAHRRIAIVILRARSNRLRDLLPLKPDLVQTLQLIRNGEIRRIGEPGVTPFLAR